MLFSITNAAGFYDVNTEKRPANQGVIDWQAFFLQRLNVFIGYAGKPLLLL